MFYYAGKKKLIPLKEIVLISTILFLSGPAKTPEGYASGSFRPTTAGEYFVQYII
jgi:hypothetical protein